MATLGQKLKFWNISEISLNRYRHNILYYFMGLNIWLTRNIKNEFYLPFEIRFEHVCSSLLNWTSFLISDWSRILFHFSWDVLLINHVKLKSFYSLKVKVEFKFLNINPSFSEACSNTGARLEISSVISRSAWYFLIWIW